MHCNINAEELLKKLAHVPVIMPTAEEQKILDEYDTEMASGKANEYHSLEEISNDVSGNRQAK